MLTHLYIQHYALINNLDIDFQQGLTALTGETGAGKSIILGALALVMGARADTKAISDGEEKCIIEATFTTPKEDKTEELIIRRELYTSGRSRSFVNDEVVTQKELTALAKSLIDIHSQHENLLLRDDSFQLGIVDALAHNDKERNTYATLYEQWRGLKQQLADLIALADKSKSDTDYLSFQLHEIEDLHLSTGEWESLNEEHYRLTHAEELKSLLEETLGHLTEEQVGVLPQLHSCRIDKISEELQSRLDSAEIELKDITDSLQHLYSDLEINPTRLQAIEERITAIEDLYRKHKVDSVEALLEISVAIAYQLRTISGFDTDIDELKASLKAKEAELAKASGALTRSRESVRLPIAQQLIHDLTQLGILHANIDIAITPIKDFTPDGQDNIQFLFAANLNQALRPVSEVASGGEISRIMLCIKALVASVNGLPTIIFDEIDTGVGGETATQMGQIMHSMSASRQIIAITHLPQIAAQADHQYKVYKADTDTHTETHISALTPEERITEIATMISGKSITEAARNTARALLTR